MENLSIYIIGGAIVALVFVIVAIISFISRNYIKVSPNQVAVFYGRKYKSKEGTPIGFKVVTGGAKFKVPIIESVQMLDLSVFSIDLEVRRAPNKDGVPVNLKGVANVKILSDEASLMAACERFLGKTPQEIQDIAFKNLEGHLRAIAGSMTIETLVGDRSTLNQKVQEDATTDLKKLGLGIDLLTIQEVTDDNGYIEQLGKKRTAEVTMEASIGKAEAEKKSTISTTTAQKEAALTENTNLVDIANSEKEREVQKAKFNAEVAKEEATAEQAGPLAKAEAQKGVVVAEQEVEKTRVEKQTEIAEAEIQRTEKHLQATVVKPAEAEKEAQILKAAGNRKAIEEQAEAQKQKLILEGEGIAAAIKSKALAEAEGIKANFLSEAEGIKAKLLAEAEGILKKAEAYEKLDETGKLMQILEVVERVAPSLVKEFAGVMEAAAKPLGNIDNISIVDFGDGNATGKFGGTIPGLISQIFAKAQAAGLDLNGLFKKIGIDPSGFTDKAGMNLKPSTETVKAVEIAEVTVKEEVPANQEGPTEKDSDNSGQNNNPRKRHNNPDKQDNNDEKTDDNGK